MLRRFLITILGILLTAGLANQSAAQVSQFEGDWVNADADTDGLTRLMIRNESGALQVQAWGSCTPVDCEWGTVGGVPYTTDINQDMFQTAQMITAMFDSATGRMTLLIEPISADQLQVTTLRQYTDASGRSNVHSVYTFNRNSESTSESNSADQAPERFFVNLDDAYLVHTTGTNSLQIASQGNVLTYGGDWEIVQMRPFLYHLRQNVWQDFYWKVNTSRQEVYRTEGGTFGELGGTDEVLNIGVEPVDNPDAPTRFFLRFNDAYLVYMPGNGTLQIAAAGSVLSYGNDWQSVQMRPFLYHLRQNNWQDFYWKVNTSRQEVYRTEGGTFGELGGTDEILNVTVEPVMP